MVSEDQALRVANGQMAGERTALLGQLAALRLARITLGVHTLSLIVDGLEQVETQAGAGDPEAKALLSRLAAALLKVGPLAAGIHLPNGS